MLYDPPRDFLKKLKLIDEKLTARWDPDVTRWKIYRDGKYIMTAQTTEGDYLPLDNRIIQRLYVIDTGRYANKWQYIQHLHLEDEELRKKKIHEQDEYIRSCHRDMAPMLRGRKTVNAAKVLE